MIPDTLRELEIDIGELVPYPGNARRGNVDVIVRSLKKNGQYRPLVVNRPTMQVLAGNHTLLAAKELGWPRIAVTYVDTDEESARRINLVDNRANDKAGWDEQALADLLGEFEPGDLGGTGFQPSDLEYLLKSLQIGSEHDGDGAPALGNVDYRLMIHCDSEAHQAELLGRLQGEGLNVQALAL